MLLITKPELSSSSDDPTVLPTAKEVLDLMDGFLAILGLTPQNGKPWCGYYNGKVNLSFKEAKDLTMLSFCASNLERVLKVPVDHDTWLRVRAYVKENPSVMNATSLVYHKKKKKISLQGYHAFSI